ncbi:hypothetical protein [Roseobacter sp. A03A-229]
MQKQFEAGRSNRFQMHRHESVIFFKFSAFFSLTQGCARFLPQ